MNDYQSFTSLIQDALALYQDHPKEINDLIYWCATLDDEARSALVFAYGILFKEENETNEYIN